MSEALDFAMDRVAIWKAARQALRETNLGYTTSDVLELARFLAGDDIPLSPISMSDQDDGDSDYETEDDNSGEADPDS